MKKIFLIYFLYLAVAFAQQVDLKVYLEGAYNNGVLAENLASLESFPLNQPFNNEPWNYNGDESVAFVPENIVDWVLVELRLNMNIIENNPHRAGFLRNDGKIVDLDGKTELTFTNLATGNYYVAVFHRNHLPIISDETISIVETPIAILNTYLRLYETDGDVASSSNLPNIQFEWNGETMTAQNVSGKAHIYKVYTGSNPEDNVTILPPSGDYLGTMALTTVNSSKVDRLAQSASQASGLDIAVSKLNEAGDEELYVIPGTWTYAGGNLDADGSVVQGLFNRSPIAGTSGHRAIGSYPKTVVLKGSFHEDTGEQFPQSMIDTRDAQIDAYLAATQWSHKKLLNYEVKSFSSWSDPNWNSIANTPRSAENSTWAVFGNADRNGIDFSFSDPEKYRMYNSNSTTTNSSTPANRMSEFFSSMTNTTGTLGDYVTNPSTGGSINNTGDNIIGITYLFKPATRFWQ